jgi:hypothetical protein
MDHANLSTVTHDDFYHSLNCSAALSIVVCDICELLRSAPHPHECDLGHNFHARITRQQSHAAQMLIGFFSASLFEISLHCLTLRRLTTTNVALQANEGHPGISSLFATC